MTLKDWGIKYNRMVHYKNHGEIPFVHDFVGPERVELFSLSDYLVSNVSGGTLWFWKRPNTNMNDYRYDE